MEVVNGARFFLKCMSSDPECDQPFTEAEILRFVDEKTYAALDRLRTEDEIQKVFSFTFDSQ
jgi:hypothetical protein